MPNVITDRGTHKNGTQGASFTYATGLTSSAFSPAAGVELVVAVCFEGLNDSGGTGDLVSTSLTDNIGDTGGTSWVQSALCTRGSVVNGQYQERTELWTRTVGTTPGSSKTITWTATQQLGDTVTADAWVAFHIWEVAGQNATPVGLTASPARATSGTTFNTDLGGVPASDSTVFGVSLDGDRDNGGVAFITQPSGWTESDELNASGAWGASMEWAFINGGSVQSPQWSGFTSGDGLLGCAVEIKAAPTAAGAVSPPPPPPYFGPFSWLWQSPHGTEPVVVTVLDAVPASPLPLVEWLRRRHDYETEQQQPRHLLDVSATQSVDAPNPQPLPVVEWLRRRPDYEAGQQPRRLVDVSETQGVPLPTPLPTVVWLRRRPDYEVEQQPRRLLDITVTQSVDSPTGAPVIRIEFLPRFVGQQARGLPVDVLAPAVTPDNPTGNVTQTPTFPTYAREPWQPRRLVDTSITQSVDSPPGIAPQPSPVPRPRWQGQQAVPLAVDLLAPVTGPFGAVQQVAGYQRVTNWQHWLQTRELDTSVTQSVDSPPGIGRPQPWVVPAARGAQWDQAVPGPIVAPDQQPNPQFNTAVYLRQAAAFQAWQKSPLFLFPSVDSPPLSGPYPTAPYRRPVPPTPYVLPRMLALPPTFFPDTNPDIIFGREPGVILGAEPAAVYGREESVLVGAEDEPIYGREP